MTVPEKILTKSGFPLYVEKLITGNSLQISIYTKNRQKCFLHWGLRRHNSTSWHIPPKHLWPEGSSALDQRALQTPFMDENGSGRIIIRIDQSLNAVFIEFVLFFAEQNRWDNNEHLNYRIGIRTFADLPCLSPIEKFKEKHNKADIIYEHEYSLENGMQAAVLVYRDNRIYHVLVITHISAPLLLHWGVTRHSRHEWLLPPDNIHPPGTTVFQSNAAETPFVDQDDCRQVHIMLSENEVPMGISFLIRHIDTGRFIKEHGRNFYIPLATPSGYEASLGDPDVAALADEIIEKEMSRNSWTLMHRFNFCCELFDRACGSMDRLALIFVWLRFSFIRQLDWQRNYNTKPNELAHAMDRLTVKLAGCYAGGTEQGELIRLIMTTLGRGSEGQRVRDEILNIMHRHRIKEVSGHFMEEWHQKLHNNTTPDDVVICESYLAFLESNGNLDTFYEMLKKYGVTKKRLENYERPIKTDPDFIPHLKDVLIRDFKHFLGILKAVHSGIDLTTAVHAARHLFDQETREAVDFTCRHHEDPKVPVCSIIENIVNARSCLNRLISASQSGAETRDLLFLDLALEDSLRVAVERNLHVKLSKEQLADLIMTVLESLSMSHASEELVSCLRHWQRLRQIPGFGKMWSLRAKAVLDRIERVLSAFMDRYYDQLQPKAEILGSAFHAEPWTITLFSEETGRGRPEFILSMLIKKLTPILRRFADLGDWQLISRGRGTGWVEVVPDLKSVQGKCYDRPTIVITDKVVGDEEISKQITTVITPETTDVVSHVAIRARNARMLFATCYEPEIIDRLKSCSGRLMTLSATPAGDVLIEENSEKTLSTTTSASPISVPPLRPDFSVYALFEDDFNEKNVGTKSRTLSRLRSLLPDWIHLPNPVALPFAVFEKVLSNEANRQTAELYETLIRQVHENVEAVRAETLCDLRKSVMSLRPPEKFFKSLACVMDEGGLPHPESWNDAWICIKRVWASKWNERAYLSRRVQGIRHDDLYMAVLIQEVVKADYSFVIHTVNPLTGNSDELYAEVVKGLGETLVGNFPGRALSFTGKKRKPIPRILSFPNKSIGLFDGGLIFRSDSNCEDLPGYAAAGIYDSVMLPEPSRVLLDYSDEPLLWNERIQKNLLTTVTRIGTQVENAMGTPQDIEGAVVGDRYFVVQTRSQVGVCNE